MMVVCRTSFERDPPRCLAVLLAYHPIRREPLTVLSFTCGWMAGELAIQNIVWQVVATLVFGLFGAFEGWAGWLGLAVAVAAGSAWSGWPSPVAGPPASWPQALGEVRSEAFPVPTEPEGPPGDAGGG
jgi:hypothetical protein